MYQVNLGNDILYYPGSDSAAIFDTELNEEIGIAGEFKFKVPPQNPLYSQLATGELVTIYKDSKEFWRGDIRSISTDFANIASVYCLEDLAWLGDEYIAPALVTNETYSQRFISAITAYNANRSAERQFTAGYITNVTSSGDCLWKTEYEWSILTSLRECICQDSGYIRVRRVTNNGTVTRYIDIVKLSDYGTQATQPIQYGYNLLDYVKESDYSNLTNVLTPYGDELETEVYDEYAARLQGTTITEPTSVAEYGRYAKAVVFDGVSNLTALNNLAAAYLSRYCQPQLTMEVKAMDLADVENIDAIKIGDSVRIVAEPFSIDQWLYLTQIRRDIQNIDKNTITMSGSVQRKKTITEQTAGVEEAIKDIPSKASVLDAAKKNAIAILNGVDGGYVTFVTNEDDQITEMRIANNLDFDQATKAWRWNVAGLAYLSRNSVNDDWTVGIAATMDGGFVADFITTGYMLADRIKGGTLTLGGLNNQGGIFSILNAGGVEKVHGDNTGITIGGTTGSKMALTTDGELAYYYDNSYSGHLLMDTKNVGTAADPDYRDALEIEDFDTLWMHTDGGSDILMTTDSDDESLIQFMTNTFRVFADSELHLESDGTIDIDGQLRTFNNGTVYTAVNGSLEATDPSDSKVYRISFNNGLITDIQYAGWEDKHDYWHSWQSGGVTYTAIVLGVGVTQAVFPDINPNYAYYPYIQSASGTSAPQIEDIVISGTTLTVTFTAVTAQQAAGNACVIKLRTVV